MLKSNNCDLNEIFHIAPRFPCSLVTFIDTAAVAFVATAMITQKQQ